MQTRSRASDWNCRVKRFLMCTQQSTSLISMYYNVNMINLNQTAAIFQEQNKSKHKLSLIGWQDYRGDQIHRKNSPT